MKIRSIAIRFGDNDFITTFIPLLESVLKAVTANDDFTKEQVVELINSGSMYHYLAFQNQFRYKDTPEEHAHIERYLKVIPNRVFLNEDADAIAMDWNNSETFYVSIYLPNAISV